MKVTVLGATGRTGRLVASMATEAGHEVTALVRDPSKLAGTKVQRVVQGDATDAAEVNTAVAGADAVVSTLGHVTGSPKDLLAKSAANVIAGMRKQEVRRLVLLSASEAIADPADRPPIGHRLVRGLMRLGMNDILSDTLLEQRLVEESGLDWTFVRAGRLTDGPRTVYRVGALVSGAGLSVSRVDVAHFMLRCVAEGGNVKSRPYLSSGAKSRP